MGIAPEHPGIVEEGGVHAAEEGGVHAAEEEQIEEAEETPAGSADVEMRDEPRDADITRWFEEWEKLPDPRIRQPRGEASAPAAAEIPASGDVGVARESATIEPMAVEGGRSRRGARWRSRRGAC